MEEKVMSWKTDFNYTLLDYNKEIQESIAYQFYVEYNNGIKKNRLPLRIEL